MKILIAYDGSKYSEAILEDLAISGLPLNDSEIIIFYVAEIDSRDVEDQPAQELSRIIREGELLVQYTVDWFCSRYPHVKIWGQCGIGTVATEILLMAQINKVDLIILGSHGRRGLSRLFLGSVSLQVLKEATCSVRIVKGEAKPVQPQRLLLAIDGSVFSEKIIAEVTRRKWLQDASVRVLHVDELMLITELHGYKGGDPTNYSEEAAEVITGMRGAVDRLQKAHIEADFVLRVGNPKYVIIQEANEWSATQIILGAKGKGKLERLLAGSISQSVAIHSDVTVEVIR